MLSGPRASWRSGARSRSRRRFLGAHALPPEANGDKDRYIGQVCEMIPALARERLADAVDAFCEGIAFSPEQTARVFAAAKAAELPVKLHADQLSNLHGAKPWQPSSARCPQIISNTPTRRAPPRWHDAGTVAVLLPGAFYVLRETATCRRSRHSAAIGVAIAIATDSNPGTSPLTSLLTRHEHGGDAVPADGRRSALPASRARRRARSGGLARPARSKRAKWCDLAIWDVEAPAELVYRIGFNPLHARVWRGE